jgi:hypothetical protein
VGAPDGATAPSLNGAGSLNLAAATSHQGVCRVDRSFPVNYSATAPLIQVNYATLRSIGTAVTPLDAQRNPGDSLMSHLTCATCKSAILKPPRMLAGAWYALCTQCLFETEVEPVGSAQGKASGFCVKGTAAHAPPAGANVLRAKPIGDI